MPILSIVIPCYNCELFIEKTIKSVIAQDFQNWELVVVDDGSKDKSAQKVEQFVQADTRVKLVKKQNGGVISARKEGLKHIASSSEYLHFLDSDDILLPNFYSEIFKFWQQEQNMAAVYVNHTFIDENDNITGNANWGFRYQPTRFWFNIIDEKEPVTSFAAILFWCKMVEPMVVMKKEAYYNTSGWDERFGFGKIGEGVVLYGEMALKSKIGYLSKSLYLYRRHGNQSSKDSKLNAISVRNTFEIWKEKAENGVVDKNKFALLFCFYNTRLAIKKELGSLKHRLRFQPIQAVVSLFKIAILYSKSYPLVLKGTKSIKELI
ncbi:MAG: glycosyltransferase family 2 protein [Chitinophagaceae bacterium]